MSPRPPGKPRERTAIQHLRPQLREVQYPALHLLKQARVQNAIDAEGQETRDDETHHEEGENDFQAKAEVHAHFPASSTCGIRSLVLVGCFHFLAGGPNVAVPLGIVYAILPALPGGGAMALSPAWWRKARDILGERIVSDPSLLEPYGRDESAPEEFRPPQAVVRPIDEGEVSAVLKLCREEKVPVTVRGAGTGLAGGCVPGRGQSCCPRSS